MIFSKVKWKVKGKKLEYTAAILVFEPDDVISLGLGHILLKNSETKEVMEQLQQETKEVMEQLQQGFRDSTPRAGCDRLQKSAKVCLVHYN